MSQDGLTIRNFQPDNLTALVSLINESDAIDRLERATTLELMEHEMSFPTVHPERDFFLAWQGERLVGYTGLFPREGGQHDDSALHSWGVVHPGWRRRGVGRRLLKAAYGRAIEYAHGMNGSQVYLDCLTRDVELDRQTLYRHFGMEPVRYFVNMARSMNGDLPPVRVPPGIRLRTFDPARDVETVWRVDNTAFRDHWGHTEEKLEEFEHWVKMPHFRPELWFLAEDTTSGEVVGLGLNVVDPDWIAQTGRREGYVDTLAVLPEHRQRGVGAALLTQSLQALGGAGMEAAHLHADADNVTGAVRLYTRLGFRLRQTSIAYRRLVQTTGAYPVNDLGRRRAEVLSAESERWKALTPVTEERILNDG